MNRTDIHWTKEIRSNKYIVYDSIHINVSDIQSQTIVLGFMHSKVNYQKNPEDADFKNLDVGLLLEEV